MPLVFERYTVQQQALAAARRCAFVYAVAGCSGPLPAGCEGFMTTEPAPPADAQSDVIALARQDAGDAEGVFDMVPLLADALEAVLGETAHAAGALPLRARGGRQEYASAHLSVACNERATTVLTVARRVLCTHLPLVDC